MGAGGGPGRASRRCPARREAVGVRGCRRQGERRRGAGAARSAVAATVMPAERAAGLGRGGARRGPVTARSGLGGFDPRARLLSGAGVGVGLLGAEERVGGPGVAPAFLRLPAGLAAAPGRPGLVRPPGAISPLGVSAGRGERLLCWSHVAGSQLLSGAGLHPHPPPPMSVLWIFPARCHFFLQCLKSRCGVDSGCLINESDLRTWNCRLWTRRGVGM